MTFTEYIKHNLGYFNDTAGETQDPAKDVLCRGRGLRLSKRDLVKKLKGGYR